jgi:hypothetical protein
MLAMLGLSLLVLPGWPLDWSADHEQPEGHSPAALILPLGPLLLLAALRWKTPKGRLLFSLSLLPQMPFFYDQLLLWLIPASLAQGLALSGLSWVAFLAWRLITLSTQSGTTPAPATQLILALIYLPALAMLLWPLKSPKYDKCHSQNMQVITCLQTSLYNRCKCCIQDEAAETTHPQPKVPASALSPPEAVRPGRLHRPPR